MAIETTRYCDAILDIADDYGVFTGGFRSDRNNSLCADMDIAQDVEGILLKDHGIITHVGYTGAPFCHSVDGMCDLCDDVD